MTDDWAARDAYANYHEALRVMRAALIEKRQRPAEAPGPGRAAGRKGPAANHTDVTLPTTFGSPNGHSED